jgi:hypothetical protein
MHKADNIVESIVVLEFFVPYLFLYLFIYPRRTHTDSKRKVREKKENETNKKNRKEWDAKKE